MVNQAIQMTPPGSAAITIVRLSGPGTVEFLRRYFSRPAIADRCVHGVLAEGLLVIDDPVVVISADGLRADVNLHGGPWVVQSFLNLAKRAGFAVMNPSEVPLPDAAIDAETRIEREIMAYLPLASTEQALFELLRQKEAWRRFETLPSDKQQAEAAEMREDRGLWWLLHPPRVAIIGAANVGKSTLANQFFGQERSITADLPGTTRDWIGEIANIDGLPVMLMDTPGLRSTVDPIESMAIAQAEDEVKAADLVILVLDGSQPLPPEHADLLERYPEALSVVNKCDLPAAWHWAAQSHTNIVATRGVGVTPLRKAIKAFFGIEKRRDGARGWTTWQHRFVSNLQ